MATFCEDDILPSCQLLCSKGGSWWTASVFCTSRMSNSQRVGGFPSLQHIQYRRYCRHDHSYHIRPETGKSADIFAVLWGPTHQIRLSTLYNKNMKTVLGRKATCCRHRTTYRSEESLTKCQRLANEKDKSPFFLRFYLYSLLYGICTWVHSLQNLSTSIFLWGQGKIWNR